jgi:hypothetical protein
LAQIVRKGGRAEPGPLEDADATCAFAVSLLCWPKLMVRGWSEHGPILGKIGMRCGVMAGRTDSAYLNCANHDRPALKKRLRLYRRPTLRGCMARKALRTVRDARPQMLEPVFPLAGFQTEEMSSRCDAQGDSLRFYLDWVYS